MLQDEKYARVERERRFLVRTLPVTQPWADRRITDLYVDGTRIRLRRSEGVVQGKPEVLRKLNQKVPVADSSDGVQGHITTMYLTENEYERLAILPGQRLTKRRLSFPPMGVDVFEGNLHGLAIAEAEFDDDESMAAFHAPPYCSREVTGLARYACSELATLANLPVELSRSRVDALINFTS